MTNALQAEFAHALTDPAAPVPAGLAARSADELKRRFGIYRNNVVTGLIDALRARFPATEKIVGEEFFIGMARLYLSQSPPRSPLLYTFGDTFADFIAAFAPAAELPYLPDVARIEAEQAHAYHAADAVPLGADALAYISLETIGAMRVELLPGTHVMRSEYPAFTIFAMNTGLLPLGEIADWRGEGVLIARDGFDVQTRRLDIGDAVFLAALGQGQVLTDAAEAASDADTAFDLTHAFSLLFDAGLITAVQPISEES